VGGIICDKGPALGGPAAGASPATSRNPGWHGPPGAGGPCQQRARGSPVAPPGKLRADGLLVVAAGDLDAVAVRTRQQLERDTADAARLAAEITAHAAAGTIPDLNRTLADWRDLTRRIETIALEHATATIRARDLNPSTRS
jgi:hypothetical protein